MAERRGLSRPTMKEMLRNPDLDKGLPENGNGKKAAPRAQPLGRDPTRRVTQAEYDKSLAKQKAAQAAAYAKYKSKKR